MPIKRLLVPSRLPIPSRGGARVVTNRGVATWINRNNQYFHWRFKPLLHPSLTLLCAPIKCDFATIATDINADPAVSSAANELEKSKGEELYYLAMDALNKAEEAKKSKEDMLLREQYEAMNKQKQRTLQREKARAERETNPKLARLNSVDLAENSRDRAAGVAVVRTIVKQSQKSKMQVQVDKHSHSKGEDSYEFWENAARRHMEEAAFRYGHPLALVRLGNDVLERDIDNITESSIFDKESSKAWIEESSIDLQRVLVLATNAADGIHESDKHLSPYQQLAACLYEEAGRQGSPEGWYNYAHLLWDSIEHNDDFDLRSLAFEAFYKSMELGDADAMYFLAVQYLSPTVEMELLKSNHDRISKAINSFQENQPMRDMNPPLIELENDINQIGYNLLRLAALSESHGPAMHHLTLLHYEVNHDELEFNQLLTEVANTGHPESLFLQGHCYYHGSDGYSQDSKAALDNFLRAAENGHVDAMISAGAILYNGVRDEHGISYIIEKDQQRAFELYQQAGEMGSMEGWRNVVHCYATGRGVPKCMETAKHIAETMLKEDNK